MTPTLGASICHRCGPKKTKDKERKERKKEKKERRERKKEGKKERKKTVWRYLRKLNPELPYDPAITLLGICPEKSSLEEGTCTGMFTAVLFTIAKTWKQPKCPSADELFKMMWYIYTMEY